LAAGRRGFAARGATDGRSSREGARKVRTPRHPLAAAQAIAQVGGDAVESRVAVDQKQSGQGCQAPAALTGL